MEDFLEFITTLVHKRLSLVLTSCRQIFFMRIKRNVTTQDQSQKRHGKV
jgi:hypothetical protein